jgi:hypothetical protein
MIRDIAEHSRSRSLTPFYGNRNARDAAFLSELKQIARENSGFRLVATMTSNETYRPVPCP